jgi:prophage regulatory protein
MTRSETEFLTDHQVAARYNIKRQTVWAWAKAGSIPSPVKLSPGCTRWNLTDLQAFEARKAGAK